jgi:peptide-methionine (R)-S-oxide reductase
MFKSDIASPRATRRAFLIAAGATAAAAVFELRKNIVYAAAPPKEVKIVQFTPTGQRGDTVTLPVVVKSDAEWKSQLSRDAYEVTRHADTERAFSGQYWNLHDKGIYHCICCNIPLFNSDTKFESGTGWPSFWQPIAKENVRESNDLSLGVLRTAVNCRLCDAHLGHVFDDGPQPTGLRYCMNSVSLKFAKLA